MLALAPAAMFGLVVGLRHAIEADHVAAVSAIVAREKSLRGAALVGAAWGLGHTATVLLFGGAIVVFGLVVPKPVGLALELCVGVMLVGLGAWNFVSRRRGGGHSHSHSHAHSHEEARSSSHDGAGHDAPTKREAPARRALRPLVVGSMHGLAGSAAVALLVVAAVGSTSWGLVYLLVFGLGTMIGMTALTTALALPLGKAMRRFERAELWLRIGSGLVSCAIGAFVIYEIGFEGGLFLQ